MSDLTLTNASYSAGVYGQALTGGYGVGASVASAGFAVELIAAGGEAALQVAAGQAGVFFLGKDGNGNALAHYGNGSSEVALSSTVKVTDTAHRLAISAGPNGGRLLVDGVVVASSAVSLAASGADVTSAPAIHIRSFLADNPTAFAWTGPVDEVAIWDVDHFGGAYTPATAAYAGTEGMAHLYHLDGNGADSAVGAVTTKLIARTDPAIYRSPEVWHDDGTSLTGNSNGAYLTLGFTGTRIGLNTVALANLTNYPLVRAYVDNLAHVDVTLAAGQTSFPLASGLTDAQHTLKLIATCLNESDDYWTPLNAVRVTGFTVDAGAVVSQLATRPLRILWFGDSITAGRRTDPALFSDGTLSIAPLVAEALGAEIGQIGFGAQGYEVAGLGGVPRLLDAWNLVSNGVPRPFTAPIDIVVDMHGTNGVPTQANVATMIAHYRSVAPAAWIFMVVPPGGYGRAAKTAAVAAAGDARVVLIDVGTAFAAGLNQPGTASEQASDGVHPFARTNARLAAQVTAQMRAAMNASPDPVTIVKRFFRQGFRA